jgi:transcriptional regulator with GAF, ATPase, and Fis domain
MGNVRELENVVERALTRSSTSPEGTFLRFDEINLTQNQSSTILVDRLEAPPVFNIDEAMKRHVESVIEMTKGKLGGDDGAAVLLGLPLSTLGNRMIKLGMLPPKKRK